MLHNVYLRAKLMDPHKLYGKAHTTINNKIRGRRDVVVTALCAGVA